MKSNLADQKMKHALIKLLRCGVVFEGMLPVRQSYQIQKKNRRENKPSSDGFY